jgi:hypothetical protein
MMSSTPIANDVAMTTTNAPVSATLVVRAGSR